MPKLQKNIGIFSGIGIAVGMVVGSGLFGLPGLAIDIAGPAVSLYGWIAIIFVTFPMIYIFIKLGTKFPKAAGLSKYAEISFGPWGSYGVTAVLSGTFTVGIPALAMIGGAYLAKLLGIDDSFTYIFAILFLFVATTVNLYGVNMASWINTISLIFIFLLIGLLIVLHPDYLVAGKDILISSNQEVDYRKLWTVMALLFWAFLGWENLSFGLEEFKNPNRSIPIVYWGSFFIISIFYFLLAMLSSGATSLGVNISGISSISALLEESQIIGKFLIFFMVMVILANANSWVFGASRLIYSAGESNILPSSLGKLNGRSIPANSLVSLFFFYTLFIIFIWLLKIDISKIIMIVSQNFLILYLASIIAFAKLFKGVLDYIVLGLSGVIVIFFLSGFGMALIYPIALLTLGYMVYKKHERVDSKTS
jgi:amino acid transporter